MPLEETMRAIEGIGRLIRLDPSGNAAFGRDVSACRRSFLAYALVWPALVLGVMVALDTEQTATPGILAAAETLATIIPILAYPILIRPVLRAYGRLDRWAWFVTGYNWFSAASIIINLGMLGLLVSMFSTYGTWLTLGVQVYLFVVEAFLADAILGIGGMRAGVLVLIDGLFNYGTEHVARYIGGAGLF